MLMCAVGAPIPVKKVEQPRPEQISNLISTFEKSLVDLFHAHKEKYHPGENIQLIIE